MNIFIRVLRIIDSKFCRNYLFTQFMIVLNFWRQTVSNPKQQRTMTRGNTSLLSIICLAIVILQCIPGTFCNYYTLSNRTCEQGYYNEHIVLMPGELFNITCLVDSTKLYKRLLKLKFEQPHVSSEVRVLLVDGYDLNVFLSSNYTKPFRYAYVNKNWLNGSVNDIDVFNVDRNSKRCMFLFCVLSMCKCE